MAPYGRDSKIIVSDKDTNPIHENATLMTNLPPKGLTF